MGENKLRNDVMDLLGAIAAFTSCGACPVPLVFGYDQSAGNGVATLAVIVAVPLAANSIASIAIARWSVDIQNATADWVADDPDTHIHGAVGWSGLTATISLTTPDGETPPIDELREEISKSIPSYVGVMVDVGQGTELIVQ